MTELSPDYFNRPLAEVDPEIADALREHYTAWQKPDGSIVGRGSVWIVAATNPG